MCGLEYGRAWEFFTDWKAIVVPLHCLFSAWDDFGMYACG